MLQCTDHDEAMISHVLSPGLGERISEEMYEYRFLEFQLSLLQKLVLGFASSNKGRSGLRNIAALDKICSQPYPDGIVSSKGKGLSAEGLA